jgi:DNA-3-methyladenine glycosylase
MKLPRDFYTRTDVIQVSKDLLGKYLFTNIDGNVSAAIITETEAYEGINDKAAHCYGDRRTKRTETMYAQGGIAYVYLCYGIHHLFNVVTNVKEVPTATLVRAVKPVEGIDTILQRRKKTKLDKTTSAGPGTLSQALGILTKHDGLDLLGDQIWIEDRGLKVDERNIIVGPRVGVDYAAEDALRPNRFILPNQFTEIQV